MAGNMPDEWSMGSFYFFLFTWETLLSVYLVCACVHVVFAFCRYPEISLYTKMVFLGCFQPMISLLIFFIIFLKHLLFPRIMALPIYNTGIWILFYFSAAVTASDCYVRLWLPSASNEKLQTKTIKNSDNPVWNETFYFRIQREVEVLKKMEILQFWIAGSPQLTPWWSDVLNTLRYCLWDGISSWFVSTKQQMNRVTFSSGRCRHLWYKFLHLS